MSGSIIIQENPLKSENKNFQGLDYKKCLTWKNNSLKAKQES